MFVLNEKVIYPGHGVAKITRVVEKEVSGHKMRFYELQFINKDMTILIPMNNVSLVGIRKLSSQESIDDVFKMLAHPVKAPVQETVVSNWNKRNKEYQLKLRTGNIQEIGKIYRDLKHIAVKKELSFGEKNLLQQTESLLAEEISLVNNTGTEIAMEQLRSIFNHNASLQGKHETSSSS